MRGGSDRNEPGTGNRWLLSLLSNIHIEVTQTWRLRELLFSHWELLASSLVDWLLRTRFIVNA